MKTQTDRFITPWFVAYALSAIGIPAMLMLQSGCAAVKAGQDPVVVNAERLAANSYDVVDAFLTLEQNQRAVLWQVDQSIKHTADKLRHEFPEALKSLRATTKAYKQNRSAENKATVVTWQAVINQLLSELYSAQAKAVKINQ